MGDRVKIEVTLAGERAAVVHARYLRQWTRHKNKAEESPGSALSRLDRLSGEGR